MRSVSSRCGLITLPVRKAVEANGATSTHDVSAKPRADVRAAAACRFHDGPPCGSNLSFLVDGAGLSSPCCLRAGRLPPDLFRHNDYFAQPGAFFACCTTRSGCRSGWKLSPHQQQYCLSQWLRTAVERTSRARPVGVHPASGRAHLRRRHGPARIEYGEW